MRKPTRHLNQELPALLLNPSNKTTTTFLILMIAGFLMFLLASSIHQQVILYLSIAWLVVLPISMSSVDYLAVYQRQRCIVRDTEYFTGARKIREHINVNDTDEIVVRVPRYSDNTIDVTFDSAKARYPLMLGGSRKIDDCRKLAQQIAEILKLTWSEIEEPSIILRPIQQLRESGNVVSLSTSNDKSKH